MTHSEDIINLDAPVGPMNDPGSLIKNDDGSVTLTLIYPFTVKILTGGKESYKEYKSITLRRPTGGDMRAIEKIKDGMQAAVTTFTRLSGEVEAIFDRLDVDDLNLITEVMEDFLAKSPKTGTKSLPQSE